MVKLLQNFVLIKALKKENLTEVGLIIPEGLDDNPINVGNIVEVGDEIKLKIKKGDTIIFKPYGFDEITIDKFPFLIGREENIMAIKQ